jgi:hypothetical protein
VEDPPAAAKISLQDAALNSNLKDLQCGDTKDP